MIKVPPINKHPTGLLGFLGIKNGGKYPQTLSDVLLPTWNLADLYLGANQSAPAPVSIAVNAVGYQAYYTVPDNETWILNQATAFNFGSLTALQTLRMAVATTAAGGNTVVVSDSGELAATVGRLTVGLHRKVIANSGDTIGILVNVIAGGPITVGLALRYSILIP